MNEDLNLNSCLQQIQGAILTAYDFVQGLTEDGFYNDKKTQYASGLCLVIIGENATLIHKNFKEFEQKCPALPWEKMRGLRNRIVHAYSTIDPEIIWATLNDFLPEAYEILKPHFESIR
jgi:uncharacterized protein with HEPN domain